MKFFSEGVFLKWSKLVAIVLLFCTIIFGLKVSDVQFDYDFEKFFPAEDEDADFFYAHRKQFEYDNNFILIGLENKSGVFKKDFLLRTDSLTKDLAKVPYATTVRSICNQEEVFLYGLNGSSSVPYINFKAWEENPDAVEELIKKDSSRIYRSVELVNTLIAKDGKSVCIFLKHQDDLSRKKSDEIVKAVRAKIANYDFDGVHLAGTSVGQQYYINKMNKELVLFMAMSAVLVIVFLFIAFRSGWGIILPQVVIFSTLIWILGGMGLFNSPMNILLTTLPSIMFVVGMSDVIHLVSRYLDALREKLSKFEAIKTTIREVGFSTFLTSVTPAVGFFSLYFIHVQPV